MLQADASSYGDLARIGENFGIRQVHEIHRGVLHVGNETAAASALLKANARKPVASTGPGY
jgi:hypothetical protein